MSALFLLGLLLLTIFLVKQILNTTAFLKRLEQEHPTLFHSLGRPRWSIQFGDLAFRQTLKKIRSHHFSYLEDEELEGFYRQIKLADKGILVSGLSLFAITAADIFV